MEIHHFMKNDQMILYHDGVPLRAAIWLLKIYLIIHMIHL